MISKTLAGCLAALSLSLCAPGLGLARTFVDEAQPKLGNSAAEPEPWREGASALPAAPDVARMRPIDIDGVGPELQYRIDPQSLEIGDDGVVRYTLAQVPAQGGLANVTREGLRCDQPEYRGYAWLDGDTWRPMSDAWLRIGPSYQDRYRQQRGVEDRLTGS